MLRDPLLGVHDLYGDRVIKLVQDRTDYGEGLATVMRQQILYVFQEQDGRTGGPYQSLELKKERALRFIGESMGSAKARFLRDSSEAKWLTWKSRRKKVMLGQTFDVSNVASLRLFAEIGRIRSTGVAIPFDGEGAFAPDCLQTQAKTANAGEEVDKPEN